MVSGREKISFKMFTQLFKREFMEKSSVGVVNFSENRSNLVRYLTFKWVRGNALLQYVNIGRQNGFTK